MKMTYKNLTIKTLACTLLLGGLSVGCITEDDGIPSDLDLPTLYFSADTTVNEGDLDETVNLTVTLVGVNKTNAIVSYAAVPGSAVADADYELLGEGKLMFAPGETVKTVQFKMIGDEVKESKEGFSIEFYNPMNCKPANQTAHITVDDDDDNTVGLVIPTGGTTSPLTYDGYNLVWADEFSTPNVNMANWSFETGEGGWGNQELQYYRPDNTSIVDGNLVITARKQNFGTSNYTSSRLVTKSKKQFKFGRIDIRAALPKGQGLWPALWMLGSNIDAVSWPTCGEIDIMEHRGDKANKVTSAVHYKNNAGNPEYKSSEEYLTGTANFQDEFHVFSTIWKQDIIEFLVDDVVYHTITPASLNGAVYPFNSSMFFIFNVAVGGTYSGDPDNSTAFPQHMIVDYVRVFQQ